jgi:hypothetical protein
VIASCEVNGESEQSAKLKKCGENGAGDRSRTDDFDLGKVALYQLSYTRPATDCNF